MIDAAFDYPSQRSGLHHPAEPMLLDTCVLQHLKYVMDALDGEYMSDEVEEDILRRFPSRLGSELVALGDLAAVFHRNGPAWVVSEASLVEFERLDNRKGVLLRQWWREWADYFGNDLDAGWYPDIDPKPLLIRQPRWRLTVSRRCLSNRHAPLSQPIAFLPLARFSTPVIEC